MYIEQYSSRLFTATDAEEVTAAAKMFEKKIDVWILEMLHFPRSVVCKIPLLARALGQARARR